MMNTLSQNMELLLCHLVVSNHSFEMFKLIEIKIGTCLKLIEIKTGTRLKMIEIKIDTSNVHLRQAE